MFMFVFSIDKVTTFKNETITYKRLHIEQEVQKYSGYLIDELSREWFNET